MVRENSPIAGRIGRRSTPAEIEAEIERLREDLRASDGDPASNQPLVSNIKILQEMLNKRRSKERKQEKKPKATITTLKPRSKK
ncbi:MAG: hypothetical protein V4449_01090 [Patescibacteria group bacterium]